MAGGVFTEVCRAIGGGQIPRSVRRGKEGKMGGLGTTREKANLTGREGGSSGEVCGTRGTFWLPEGGKHSEKCIKGKHGEREGGVQMVKVQV